jgi:hypothetical protein
MHCALQKHSSTPTRLVCLTDDDKGVLPAVECIPFPAAARRGHYPWRAWWLKACLFAPETVTKLGIDAQNGSWLFYIDLDTVICGDLCFPHTRNVNAGWRKDGNIMYTFGTSMFANENRQDGINSSVLLWYEPPPSSSSSSSSSLSSLYTVLESYYTDVTQVIWKFDHYLEMLLHARGTKVVCLEKALGDIIVGDSSSSSSSSGGVTFADFLSIRSRLSGSSSLTSLRGELGIDMVCFPLEPKPHAVRAECAWIEEYFSAADSGGGEEVD